MATGSSHTTKMYLKLLQTVKDEGITPSSPRASRGRSSSAPSTLTVLPQPPRPATRRTTTRSALRLQYGDFSVLMTGDSEEDERRVVDRPTTPSCSATARSSSWPITAAATAPTSAWLDLLQPELAVASLGTGNDYGHPHAETVSLLRKNEIPLLRTDQRGTITIVSDGRTWNLVNPQLARRQRPARTARPWPPAPATTKRNPAARHPPGREAGGDDASAARRSRNCRFSSTDPAQNAPAPAKPVTAGWQSGRTWGTFLKRIDDPDRSGAAAGS